MDKIKLKVQYIFYQQKLENLQKIQNIYGSSKKKKLSQLPNDIEKLKINNEK